MYCPWPEEDPYIFLGEKVKGQDQISTLKFALFPHDKSITFWHTMMILHTSVDHDPRRTSFVIGVKRWKVKVKFRCWTWQNFCTMTLLSFDLQWWFLMHVLPVIWGATLLILGSKVKVKLWKFEFVAAGVFVPFRTGFIFVLSVCLWQFLFYAPGLKGPPGASSNRIVRPSVCPSVPLSGRP